MQGPSLGLARAGDHLVKDGKAVLPRHLKAEPVLVQVEGGDVAAARHALAVKLDLKDLRAVGTRCVGVDTPLGRGEGVDDPLCVEHFEHLVPAPVAIQRQIFQRGTAQAALARAPLPREDDTLALARLPHRAVRRLHNREDVGLGLGLGLGVGLGLG